MTKIDGGPNGPEDNIPNKNKEKSPKELEKNKQERLEGLDKERREGKESSPELVQITLEKLEEDKEKLDQAFDAVGSELAQFEHWDDEEKILVSDILAENHHNYSEYEAVIQSTIDQGNAIAKNEIEGLSSESINSIVDSHNEIITQLDGYKNKLQNISQTLAKLKETLPDSSVQENSKEEYKRVLKNYSYAVNDFILDGVESSHIKEKPQNEKEKLNNERLNFIYDSVVNEKDQEGEEKSKDLSEDFVDVEHKLRVIKTESKKDEVDLEDFSETMSENSIKISPEMQEVFVMKNYFEMHPGLQEELDKKINILAVFKDKLIEDMQSKYGQKAFNEKIADLDKYNVSNIRQLIKDNVLQNVNSKELLKLLKDRMDRLTDLKAEMKAKSTKEKSKRKEKLRGWTTNVLKCVEDLGKNEFTLQDMYGFEDRLSKKYPKNQTIKSKIRQQLQVLRDKGYLEFLTPGNYRLIKKLDGSKPEVEESELVSSEKEAENLEDKPEVEETENLEDEVSEVEESELVSGVKEVENLEDGPISKTESIEVLDDMEEISAEEYEEHFWEGAKDLESDYQGYIEDLEDLATKLEGGRGEKIKKNIDKVKATVSGYIKDKYDSSSDEVIKSQLINYIDKQKQGLKKFVDNLKEKGLLLGQEAQAEELETQTLVNEGITKDKTEPTKPRETVLDGSKIPPKPDLVGKTEKTKEVTEMAPAEKLNEFWDNNEKLEEDIEVLIDKNLEEIQAQVGDQSVEDLLGKDIDDLEENIFDNITEYITNNYGQADDKAIADWIQKYIKTRFENTKNLISDAQEDLPEEVIELDESDLIELSPEEAKEVFWDGNEVVQTKFNDTLDKINAIRNSLISDGLIESSQLDDWQSVVTERVDDYLNKYGNEQSEKELETWVKGYLSSTLEDVERFNKLLRDGKISGEDFSGIISGEKEIEDLDYNVEMPKDSIEIGEQLAPRDREKIEGIKAAIGSQPKSLEFLQDYLEANGLEVDVDEITDNLDDKDFRKLVERGLNKYRQTETLAPRDREKIEGIKAAIGSQPESLEFLQDYLEANGLEVDVDEITDNLDDKDFRKLVERGLNKYRQTETLSSRDREKIEGIKAAIGSQPESLEFLQDYLEANGLEVDVDEITDNLDDKDFRKLVEKGLNKYRQENKAEETVEKPVEGLRARDRVATTDVEKDFFKRGEALENPESDMEEKSGPEEMENYMIKAKQFAKLYEAQLSKVNSEIALIEARIREIQNTDVDVGELDKNEAYLKEHGERSAELTNLYERLRKLDIKKARLENLSLKYKSDFELYQAKKELGKLSKDENIIFTEEEKNELQNAGIDLGGTFEIIEEEKEEEEDAIGALNKAIASVKAKQSKQPVVSTDEADFISKKDSSGLGELGEVVPADELDFEEEKLEEISIRDFPVRERRQLRSLAVDKDLELDNTVLETYKILKDNSNEILQTFLETVEDDTEEELQAKSFTYTNKEGDRVTMPADVLVSLDKIAKGI